MRFFLLAKSYKIAAWLVVFLSLSFVSSACKSPNSTSLKSVALFRSPIGPILEFSVDSNFLQLLGDFPTSLGQSISFPIGKFALGIQGNSFTKVTSQISTVANENYAQIQINSLIDHTANYSLVQSRLLTQGEYEVLRANTNNQISAISSLFLDQQGLETVGPVPNAQYNKTLYESNLPSRFIRNVVESSFSKEVPNIESSAQNIVWKTYKETFSKSLPAIKQSIQNLWETTIVKPLLGQTDKLKIGDGLRFYTSATKLKASLQGIASAQKPEDLQTATSSVQLSLNKSLFNNFFNRYLKAGHYSTKDISDLFSRLPLVDIFAQNSHETTTVGEDINEDASGITLLGSNPIRAEIQENKNLVFTIEGSFHDGKTVTSPVKVSVIYTIKKFAGYISIQRASIHSESLTKDSSATPSFQSITQGFKQSLENIAIQKALTEIFPNDLVPSTIVVKEPEKNIPGMAFKAAKARFHNGWLQVAWQLEDHYF